jgi:hypothetical protein
LDGCSLFALIACFSWQNLYLDTALIHDDAVYWELSPTTQQLSSVPKNPFGRAAIGYELRFSNLSLAIEGSHQSSLASGDDGGINSVAIRARWYPFRRRSH